MSAPKPESRAYAFRIDHLRDDYVYFRTVSLYSDGGKHGRDIRKAHPVDLLGFAQAVISVGDTYTWIWDSVELPKLLEEDCWGIVPIALAENQMSPMLRAVTCVKSPLGLYFDTKLPRGRASGRRPSPKMIKHIRSRDGDRCVLCKKGIAEGVTLESGHIMPYSGGWELSENNLVTLCSSCNNGQGNKGQPHLFALVGVHHGWDPSLLKGVPNAEAGHWLIALSQNMLVSRFNIKDLPSIASIDGHKSQWN